MIPIDAEDIFWWCVKDSSHPQEFEIYLRIYPRGKYIALAEFRLKLLKGTA